MPCMCLQEGDQVRNQVRNQTPGTLETSAAWTVSIVLMIAAWQKPILFWIVELAEILNRVAVA